MSRGLGRLQRFIKAQIYRADREYRRESVAMNGRRKIDPALDPLDEGTRNFWLTWPDIRYLIEENPEFNPGPYRISPSLERSAKRALQLLVERGEIARLRGGYSGYLNQYVTKEIYQRTFSPEAMRGFTPEQIEAAMEELAHNGGGNK
jgi:hypothetical protein